MSNKKAKDKRELEMELQSGLLELAGLETKEEAKCYRELPSGALDVGRPSWEETLRLSH
jgi:hypothetical protein